MLYCSLWSIIVIQISQFEVIPQYRPNILSWQDMAYQESIQLNELCILIIIVIGYNGYTIIQL